MSAKRPFAPVATLATLLIVIGLTLTQSSFASVTPVTGSSEFVAIGKPSALKIHGQGDGVKGTLNIDGAKISGDITFALNQFTTGVDLRDKHMKEKYLETEKFPEAHLVINDLALSKSPATTGFEQKQAPFKGTMTLHGVTKPVEGTVDVKNTGGEVKGDAQFNLKITDYKIPVPRYLGITVADTVEVKTHVTAKMAKATP